MKISSQQTTYDERLRVRVIRGGADAVEAAIVLMERHDPDSLELAQNLIPNGPELSPRCREVIAEAWDRYFHMRNMSWE